MTYTTTMKEKALFIAPEGRHCEERKRRGNPHPHTAPR